MSTVNPYLPPRADVADVEDATTAQQPLKIWSASGRIGRLRYLAWGVGGYLVFAFAAFLLGVVAGVAGKPSLAGVLPMILLVPYVVFFVLVTIQRSHDMDWSGWTCLAALIPLVGFIWLLKGGTAGNNRFGAPPPPNTWGVRLFASVAPVIMVVGILAAIAIPAYQQYQVRAKAAQMR